ncbi:MAG: DUF4332 domain-containing protein [Paludibacter sp.]
MNDNYFINVEKFSIEKFKNILTTKDILPGRVVLKEALEERFELLKSRKIDTLSDLLDTLKTKSKIEKFSNDTGLSVEYLTILRREANSYISVPIRLIELLFVETDIINILEANGIRDSKQLFDMAAKRSDRRKIAEKFELPMDKLLELVRLCDLVRITGVGPVFARIIYDAGIYTVNDFMSYDSIDLFERLKTTNDIHGWTKTKFTLKDIEYCINLGRDLPIVIEND